MQEYSVLPFSLMLCTSFDDFTDAQQKFSETLVADYRAAAERVANSVPRWQGAGQRSLCIGPAQGPGGCKKHH